MPDGVVERMRGHATGQLATPNARPITAVSAIAITPQKVTRNAPFAMFAPPTRAAIAPSTARKASESVAMTGWNRGSRGDEGRK